MCDHFCKLAASTMNAPYSEFYEIESEVAASELHSMDFCKGLVAALSSEFPSEFSNHKFYKWEKQDEDIHICWGLRNPISIQIDPHCEVICALGNEFGSWSPDDDAVTSFVNAYKSQHIAGT